MQCLRDLGFPSGKVSGARMEKNVSNICKIEVVYG